VVVSERDGKNEVRRRAHAIIKYEGLRIRPRVTPALSTSLDSAGEFGGCICVSALMVPGIRQGIGGFKAALCKSAPKKGQTSLSPEILPLPSSKPSLR
jgi:hypothetical protein